jgi:MFS family permease
VFELGSLLCAVATSSKMLIVGRAVAGAGGSGIVSGIMTILAHVIPLEKRAGNYSTEFKVVYAEK